VAPDVIGRKPPQRALSQCESLFGTMSEAVGPRRRRDARHWWLKIGRCRRQRQSHRRSSRRGALTRPWRGDAMGHIANPG